MGVSSEQQAKYQNRYQRLQNGPAGSDGGLLVANLDITPDQEVDQLARAPYLAQAKSRQAFVGSMMVRRRCGGTWRAGEARSSASVVMQRVSCDRCRVECLSYQAGAKRELVVTQPPNASVSLG